MHELSLIAAYALRFAAGTAIIAAAIIGAAALLAHELHTSRNPR